MAEKYHKMRATVRKALPQLIEHKYEVNANKTERRGALKALAAITELLGPKGEYWIKGDYHLRQDGFDSFCLSGAFNKIDGAHEALARAALHIAIVELAPETLDGAEITDQDDQPITNFNDDQDTKWADVKRVLKRAAEILQS